MEKDVAYDAVSTTDSIARKTTHLIGPEYILDQAQGPGEKQHTAGLDLRAQDTQVLPGLNCDRMSEGTQTCRILNVPLKKLLSIHCSVLQFKPARSHGPECRHVTPASARRYDVQTRREGTQGHNSRTRHEDEDPKQRPDQENDAKT